MAIDTHAKRRAALGHLQAWRPTSAVLPDATTSVIDRAAQLAIYTFPAAVVATEPGAERGLFVEQARGMFVEQARAVYKP